MPGEHLLVIDDSPTILKVVQLALTKGGYDVQVAPDGESGVAAARETRPDLILLDFVMPGMNGYQVCRALSEESALASIPVVLMSAKGEEIGERFVKVTSVVDYITKPFSPEALLAVVSHTIEKHAREKGRATLAALAATDPAALSEPEGTRAVEGAGPSGVALTGDLGVISISEVLSLLSDQSQTGVLEASSGDSRVTVFFRGGRIDLAVARGVSEEFLLGRFAVEAGHISAEALAAVIAERSAAAGTPGLLGADLRQRGLLTEAALKEDMTRQTAELVYEILRWSAGRFTFRATATEANEAALAIAVDNLLLEGFRRVDEWRLIEREIESFDLVFVRNEERIGELGRGRLTRDEANVLEFVNGRNSVKDAIRLSQMGSFDVTKMLYRLLRIKLIRRRMVPLAV